MNTLLETHEPDMNSCEPRTCALFLDLDGTLVEIASAPEGVVAPRRLAEFLGDLTMCLGGALAIISGRPISDVDRILAPLAPSAAGIHGAELRAAPGGPIEYRATAIEANLVANVRRLIDEYPGVLVETKRASIAVHYRQAPSVDAGLEVELRRMLEDDKLDHLILAPGRKVLEIVPRHISKGAALEAMMDLPAFRGRRPIMIGDDASDQSAFDAALRLGGIGLKVAGEHFAPDEADFSGPAEVRAWLQHIAEAPAS